MRRQLWMIKNLVLTHNEEFKAISIEQWSKGNNKRYFLFQNDSPNQWIVNLEYLHPFYVCFVLALKTIQLIT